MRIRNRIKRMIAVENLYYNREGAVAFLTGVSTTLICFNLIFSIFNYYGNEQTESNLRLLRYSAYLLITYLLFFISYRFALRYRGYRYPLITGFTGIALLADTGMSYLLFRNVFCWNLDRLIENPLGFEPILRRSFDRAFLFSMLFLLAMILYTLIPAKRQTPILLGRFYPLNILSPLLVVPSVLLVVAIIPEDIRVEYTRRISIAVITVLLSLSIRFFYKTILYGILLLDEQKMAVEVIPSKKNADPDSEAKVSQAVDTEIAVSSEKVTGFPQKIVVSSDISDVTVPNAAENEAVQTYLENRI